MLYRGEDSQITSYLERAVSGELSGNLADVCPVGALLQKPQSSRSGRGNCAGCRRST